MQQRAGLKSGDRIAIMLPNLLQYPLVMFGALRAGLIVVNTNPLYTAVELERHVIVTGVGDLLHWPKSAVVNFVLRHVQRRVPRWRIAGAHRLSDVLREA